MGPFGRILNGLRTTQVSSLVEHNGAEKGQQAAP